MGQQGISVSPLLVVKGLVVLEAVLVMAGLEAIAAKIVWLCR